MSKKTIDEKILDYMKRGRKVNQMLCYELWNYTRLSATIHNLKQKGIDIKSKWSVGNSGKRYKEYWVVEKPKNENTSQSDFGFMWDIKEKTEWPD